ncbi:LETM1-related biofilm-associated protein [Flavobacterium sp.]|uniref:LETM1-related biofilm-associated protein n=1 Tax=Flavobacterium sp. TaxID=239 RepID=UPI00286E1697|nr:LETM1-related biofilm-associated protein [Flavobacterium sp.]
MINPSTSGWIDKFFTVENNSESRVFTSSLSFYKKIRETGFIYGHVVLKFENSEELKPDEISKIALLDNLYSTFQYVTKETDSKTFVAKTLEFYKEMNPKGFDFLSTLISSSKNIKLERLLDDRVQTNKDIISKNFSNIVTNALLFVDILAYKLFLAEGEIPEKYVKRIEEMIMSIVSLSLQVKINKSSNDDLLIKLFEASVRYTKFSKINIKQLENLPLDNFKDDLEKFYFLDLAVLTMYNDAIIENDEVYFLNKLGKHLKISEKFVSESITATNQFIKNHKKNIQYFNYSNPVKHFYDQTTSGVQVLIKRNKKRLTKEISQSKELMHLLAKSTNKDLSLEEKKKVKKQLLDICKTIPSLTIFLIPGGGLLLPILIKFIPQLLPSSFNENLED